MKRKKKIFAPFKNWFDFVSSLAFFAIDKTKPESYLKIETVIFIDFSWAITNRSFSFPVSGRLHWVTTQRGHQCSFVYSRLGGLMSGVSLLAFRQSTFFNPRDKNSKKRPDVDNFIFFFRTQDNFIAISGWFRSKTKIVLMRSYVLMP